MNAPFDPERYPGRPVPPSHPSSLWLAARAAEIPAATPPRCRVLELACGDGANLVPLAYRHPEMELVGLDASRAQLDAAEDGRARLGLDNLTLVHGRVEDVDAERLGEFDYVVAHGLLSWITPAARERAVALCRAALRPAGVAFVSFNCAPGWVIRGPMRQALLRRARGAASPEEALARVRELLHLFATSPAREMPYSALLAEEAARVLAKPDAYLWHEYLAEEAHALSSAEMTALAGRHGLVPIAELGRASSDRRGEELLVEGLREQLDSEEEAEELADLMLFRAFRMRVLARHDAPRASTPIEGRLSFAGAVRPVEARPSLEPHIGEPFETREGLQILTSDASLKAALLELGRAWPAALDLDALLERATTLLSVRRVIAPGEALGDDARRALSADLLELARLGHLGLVFGGATTPAAASDTPRVSPLTRWEAARAAEVSDPYHRVVGLDPLTRRLVGVMDGYRPVDALVELARELVARGEISLHAEEDQSSEAMIPELVRSAIEGLARDALLV